MDMQKQIAVSNAGYFLSARPFLFYTLLLAISEFILFDYAYTLAAAVIILLISLYAKAHFRSWKSASIFGC